MFKRKYHFYAEVYDTKTGESCIKVAGQFGVPIWRNTEQLVDDLQRHIRIEVVDKHYPNSSWQFKVVIKSLSRL